MPSKRQLERDYATVSSSAISLRDQLIESRAETAAVQARINDLAMAHTPELSLTYEAGSLPVVRDGEVTQLGSVFKRDRIELKCKAKNCPYHWPCPTYLWATESEPFSVAVVPKGT